MTTPTDPPPVNAPDDGLTDDQRAKRDALHGRARQFQAASDAYLAVKNPSGQQTQDQVRLLTLGMASMARLVVGEFTTPLEDASGLPAAPVTPRTG